MIEILSNEKIRRNCLRAILFWVGSWKGYIIWRKHRKIEFWCRKFDFDIIYMTMKCRTFNFDSV